MLGVPEDRADVGAAPLRVLDEVTHTFAPGSIAEVFDKGVQPVYRLKLGERCRNWN